MPHLAQPPFSQTNLYLRPSVSPETLAWSPSGLPERASPETSRPSTDQLTTLYLEVLDMKPLESTASAYISYSPACGKVQVTDGLVKSWPITPQFGLFQSAPILCQTNLYLSPSVLPVTFTPILMEDPARPNSSENVIPSME